MPEGCLLAGWQVRVLLCCHSASGSGALHVVRLLVHVASSHWLYITFGVGTQCMCVFVLLAVGFNFMSNGTQVAEGVT
jgi:hypothetical protein